HEGTGDGREDGVAPARDHLRSAVRNLGERLPVSRRGADQTHERLLGQDLERRTGVRAGQPLAERVELPGHLETAWRELARPLEPRERVRVFDALGDRLGGQRRAFLVHPGEPSGALELVYEPALEWKQVDDVSGGVVELCRRERTHRPVVLLDRKSTRLNSSHVSISYAVFCLKKKKTTTTETRGVTS